MFTDIIAIIVIFGLAFLLFLLIKEEIKMWKFWKE